MLQRNLPPDSPHLRHVEQLRSAALRAKELVGRILAFSRQSDGKILPVHAQTIVKEVVKLCRATIPANIAIGTTLQADCPSVRMDPSRLHQVAMNLIVNAYHAVERRGGSISVGLKETALTGHAAAEIDLSPGRYVQLAVADTGCGIEPAHMKKIFDPYFTTKEQGKGTGLGLAVVYGIVKEMQGGIRIASEVGKGTTVEVFLPLAEERPGKGEGEEADAVPTGNEHILLVDDEEMVLEIARLILEGLGYRVTARMDSVEALELFRNDSGAYDLVITDLTMPRMTGERLASELLAIDPDIPVIICSGYSEAIGIEQVKTLGVKELLLKPITVVEISQKVRKVLDAAAARRDRGTRPA